MGFTVNYTFEEGMRVAVRRTNEGKIDYHRGAPDDRENDQDRQGDISHEQSLVT